MCGELKCLDVSGWTAQVPQILYYVVTLHFFEPVYRLMKEQLLEQLELQPSSLIS
jgi:hypothetical protein